MFEYSVVIPFGKKAGNFSRCINGVLQQTIAPKKIFIICNGEVTEDYAKNLLRSEINQWSDTISIIQPVLCNNANVARNLGLRRSETDWVAFLDSDDWWERTWVQSVESINGKNFLDFYYGSIRVFFAKNSSKDLICEDWKSLKTPENYLLAYKPAQTSTYFIKTKLAKDVEWDETLRRHQDYDFFSRLIKKSELAGTVPGVHVNVDWVEVRRHNFHMDCLKVVREWKPHVDSYYYKRHIANLIISSIRSKDWRAVPSLIFEYFSSFGYDIFSRSRS